MPLVRPVFLCADGCLTSDAQDPLVVTAHSSIVCSSMERPTITADNIECFRSFFELRKWEKVSTKLSLPDDRDRQDQLTPWHFWALVCLARHHLRQNWVADIVQFRLQGNLEAISAAGSFGHPEIPQTGIVPKTMNGNTTSTVEAVA